jgi:hypothetical protein
MHGADTQILATCTMTVLQTLPAAVLLCNTTSSGVSSTYPSNCTPTLRACQYCLLCVPPCLLQAPSGLLDALAGAIPVAFEVAGCLLTLALKLAYDHTAWGKQQQLQQAVALQEQIVK